MINPDIDLLEGLLECKKRLVAIQKTNSDLSEHLIGSIIQLLKYGEKYNVKIPKKEQLEQILLNTKFLWNEHNQAIEKFNQVVEKLSDQPKVNMDNDQPSSNQNPIFHILITGKLSSICWITSLS